MKKTSQNIPEERPAAPQYGFRKLRPLKIPKAAWFAMGLSLLMAVTIFVLYAVSFKETGNTGKTLVIYTGGTSIQEVSLRNSLAAADFSLELVEPDKRSAKPDYVYELPKGTGKGKVVVMAVGSDAFKVMNDLLSTAPGDVDGFILVDPDYPGNASLENYSSDYPSEPCAVFGLDSGAKSSGELNGAQMIFEKISGVDTMYGHAAQRGRIFPSKVFVSNNQLRYLSLSSVRTGTAGLLALPSFQSELAQYLGTTFGSGYSSARVTVWNVLLVLSLFLSVASLALFLFMVPVSVPDRGEKLLRGRDSLGAIIFLGVSGWLALCGAVMTFIPQTGFLVKYVAVYSPAFIIALMALAQIKIIADKKITYTRKDYGFTIFLASVLTGLVEIMIIVAASLNLTNVESRLTDVSRLIVALIIFVVMSISAVALVLADKKSRFSGQGPAAYFASPMYFIEALIPSSVILILGLINGNSEIIRASLAGIATGVLPFVCAVPIKRISDYYEITGLVFGGIAAIIIFVFA